MFSEKVLLKVPVTYFNFAFFIYFFFSPFVYIYILFFQDISLVKYFDFNIMLNESAREALTLGIIFH